MRTIVVLVGIIAVLAAVLASALTGSATAEEFAVNGNCHNGQPHGPYELKMPDGQVRVSGAFNRGKRTGTFLFWSSGGARLALLPYDEDVLSGTVALWYFPASRLGESRPKLEAIYVNGRPSGTKRSWYPNGRVRAEFRYDGGVLKDARAWSETAVPLTVSEARALATRDAENDAKYYETLAQIVRTHLPVCHHAPQPSQGK